MHKGFFGFADIPNGQDEHASAQGAARKQKEQQTEAARKEIAELMAKAKADMDKEGASGDAEAAKSQADDLQKEVWLLSESNITRVL